MATRLSRGRAAAGLAVLLLLLSTPLWGAAALRRVDAFQVRRVEISGLRLLAPHEALAASGVRAGQNVWDEPDAWLAALQAHPVVESAEIERRLPGTLRIRVREKQPVALLETPVLRPVTAAGELLPAAPAGSAVDLPLLRVASGARRDSAAAIPVPLLAELERYGRLDPELVGRVSEVRAEGAGVVRVALSRPRADVLLPSGAGAAQLQRLGVLLREVERRALDAGQPRGPRLLIDLRYADQIVLRVPNSV